ncbi:MAG: ABC transporter permease [Saprospiraceae bacterium]|nr:ABC transporter permease [Saprospiraceae bacterium]
MFQNHLRLALRNLWHQKSQTAILVFGLALGLATCFYILLWVKSELSYDQFHQEHERIYRVTEKIWTDGSGEYCASAPVALGPTLLNELPHLLENQTRIMQLRATTYLLENGADRRFSESKLYFADPGVFNMFSFELKKGDPSAALLTPNCVVLTESAVRKYFGDSDPIGKTLRFESNLDLTVTGVAADVPSDSHCHFDVLVSFSTLDNILTNAEKNGFYWNPAWTYVLLRENVQIAQFEAALPGIIKKYFPIAIRDVATLPVQRLSDIHLQSTELVGELEPNGSVAYVQVFAVVAIFVLLIAVINFINLSTAQSIRRMKEIGLRKTLGAGRSALVAQMLGEAVLTSLLSGIVAAGIMQASLPYLNNLTNKTFTFNTLWQHGGWFLGGALATGLLAGLYPAFYLSSFRPALAVKGVFEKPALRSRTQQALVVVQFAISVALILATIVANRQFQYLREARLGYDRAGVLILPVSRCALSRIDRFDDFRRQLLQNQYIKNVTALEEPLGVRSNTGTYQTENSDTERQFSRLYVRDGFLETFGIELLAGRSFSENRLSDSLSVIINEAMVRHLGWGSPENALQKRLNNFRVVGVTKDYHFASLHTSIEPLILHVPFNDRQNGFFMQYMAVKVAQQDFGAAIRFLQATWEKQVPDRAFEYTFLDDDHAKLYASEARLGQVALIFNLLSVLIACMGLVGLATYLLGQRTKEIGIRKVLGASVSGITGLLARDFLILVVLAIVIASPVSYFFMGKWLSDFAYHIELQWWMFALAGFATIVIALLTVGFQSIRAAVANPVKSLRSE